MTTLKSFVSRVLSQCFLIRNIGQSPPYRFAQDLVFSGFEQSISAYPDGA
jgi:hypothetical protein